MGDIEVISHGNVKGEPIQIIIYPERMEIKNPGGLYGRMQIDQLGKIQPDTRNPVLVTALETMNITENRYSGIPTIRRTLKEAGFWRFRTSLIMRKLP